MNGSMFRGLSRFDSYAWPVVLNLGIHLVIGIVIGVFYFRTLWSCPMEVACTGWQLKTLAVMIVRFMLLIGLLVLTSLEGVLPLMLMTLGVLVGLIVVVRHAEPA